MDENEAKKAQKAKLDAYVAEKMKDPTSIYYRWANSEVRVVEDEE
jgi:hypothetical protein